MGIDFSNVVEVTMGVSLQNAQITCEGAITDAVPPTGQLITPLFTDGGM